MKPVLFRTVSPGMKVSSLVAILFSGLALMMGASRIDAQTGSRGEGPVAATTDLARMEPNERFDFLLGEWSYEFASGHGETRYKRSSSGTAIVEFLEPGIIGDREFTGMSLFMYGDEAGWKQNWIDTLGNVLQGTGGMAEYESSDKPAMIIEFEFQENYFRHVWYDIQTGRFETDLFVSKDGPNYTLVRRMPYLRN